MPLQGISQVRKAPQFNELRAPVSLIRTLRAPNNDWGYDQRVKPYWTGWAKWEPGVGRFLEAGAEELISDVFTIRWHAGIGLKDFDFLVWDKRYFKVQGSMMIGQTIYYQQLHCTEYHTVGMGEETQVVTEEFETETGEVRREANGTEPPTEPGTPLFWPYETGQ